MNGKEDTGTVTVRNAGKGRKIKYLLTAAASLLAVLYLLYHIFGGFSGGVSLFTVTLTEAERVYDVNGAIFKSEKVVSSKAPGVVDRLLPDGGKFSADSCVAEVYYSDNAESDSDRLAAIDRKIEIYEKSSLKNQGYVPVSTIDAEISAWYSAAAKNGAGHTAGSENEILILLAKRELAVSGRTDYDSELEALYASRAKLISSLGTASERIVPGEAGWYFPTCDGYENVYSADLVKSSGTYILTVPEFEALAKKTPAIPVNPAGSYMTSATWYYVAEIPLPDASIFTEGKSCGLDFEYADAPVKCELAKIVADTAEGKALLIFRSDAISGMSFVRTQSAAITVSTVTGLRVPVSSLRVLSEGEKPGTGVYILYKGCAYFRRVTVLFESEGYYVCDASGKSGYLSLNDRIITGEKDLYDGKVIK